MFSLRTWQKRLALGLLAAILGLIGVAIYWLADNYRPAEFSSVFFTSIVATVIGVLIGALVGIFATIAVINPYLRRKEEERLEPLRRPILLFWDHTLSLYATSVLQALICPPNITRAVSQVSLGLSSRMDSLVDEEKLVEIQTWLKELNSKEELSVLNLSAFQQTLDELRRFMERMRGTLVALPYLFKETPEVANGIEMLLSNFLSGLGMLEYKADHESEGTRLDYYSTAIIKRTIDDSVALIREIRRARLKHKHNQT